MQPPVCPRHACVSAVRSPVTACPLTTSRRVPRLTTHPFSVMDIVPMGRHLLSTKGEVKEAECRAGSRLAIPDASDGTGAGGQGPQGRTTPLLSPTSAPACDCQPLGAQPLFDPKSVSSSEKGNVPPRKQGGLSWSS
uniref:Uncharacterized protein n=1 Tax=Rangifer tarandus platyrhynchus TaxID=3082113 RepID=A0ACB0EJR2_RANTA|nr:unnamed protein product [Rangifer tarandus platyrhynchus]